MSSIVRCKVKDKIYLYESEGYRDKKDGNKVKNRRRIIGKVDPETGEATYKQDYIDKMEKAGSPLDIGENQKIFSIKDVKNSSVFESGLTSFLEQNAKNIGLMESLEAAFGIQNSAKIFALASHLIANGDPFMHCQNWIEKVEISKDAGNLSSQRISELLRKLTYEERTCFFNLWCAKRTENEYLALDITSVSSYSELIGDVEWGYNRDGEDLPQINLCMLMGENSRLPIYQQSYAGSLRDVSTLQSTIKTFDAITNGASLTAVMDKGFASKDNVTYMLNCNMDFILAMPFSSKFTNNLVEKNKKSMDTLKNTILLGSETLRAKTVKVKWEGSQSVFAHIFFSPKKQVKDRENAYACAISMKETAESDLDRYAVNASFNKLLNINLENSLVEIDESSVNKKFSHSGWLVIISNCVDNFMDAIQIYRAKDVVEKGFLKLKNSLDMGRLRVHNDVASQNKLFIGFIALIMLSHTHAVMSKKNLYLKYTMKQLFFELSKLHSTVSSFYGTFEIAICCQCTFAPK